MRMYCVTSFIDGELVSMSDAHSWEETEEFFLKYLGNMVDYDDKHRVAVYVGFLGE